MLSKVWKERMQVCNSCKYAVKVINKATHCGKTNETLALKVIDKGSHCPIGCW